ncbi:ATP-binding protein [Actinacidiphila acididurans]|uniref:Tetratricopeptide repeat protein n=1 Tax=Actinacidiphila acididurans TaxID=2784346 RepID=A0ABS2TZS1_9ACTN|nr:tetratricopeptide repeat protein [Actinacidiphila acididurans]MBM9508843.1 tetratricopeptide repeat protein [Actinacidiphila acididurans]
MAGPERADAPGPTPRQLPADVHGFVNRTGELAELDAILTGQDGSRPVVSVYVIAGTAGAGKTSLALHWAHQVTDRFPDGQLYANLRGYEPAEPVTAVQAVHGFLRALGVRAADVPQDLDGAAALYRSLLADRRMLVLLDNAATPGQVRPLLPGSGDSLVVVTSRSRLAGLAVRDGARRLTLGTLPAAEAVALLRVVTSGYRPEEDLDKLSELADLCARLPLALRIAGERAAAHPHLGLDDLIADLRDESALWDALSTGSDDEAEAVRTVFAWSYSALPDPAARLFRLLGLHPGPEFGLHAAAALAGAPVPRTRQLLDDLVGAHLLEQTAPDRYQFHDLLRAYATDQAHTEEPPEHQEAALRRVLDWYLRTADAAQQRIRPAEPRVPLAEPMTDVVPGAFADYDAAVDWAEREYDNCLRAVRAATSAGFDDLAWRLALATGNARSPSSPPGDWVGVAGAGLAAAERSGTPAYPRILLFNRLGIVLRAVSRFEESLDCHRRALALARDTGHRPEEARSLNLIGLIHLDSRRLGLADRHFAEAETIFREENDTHRAVIALSNVASTRQEAGRLPEAGAAARQALALHRELDNQSGVGNILYVLAELHCEQGEIAEARRAVDEALGIALALRNHRLEGFLLITLGTVQQAAGEYGDALASYQRSAMLHRRLGDRSREALAWRGAGETYLRMDRPEEAADFHRRAVAVHRELGDTWNHAVELVRLAAALVDADPAAARRHWVEALQELAGYDDPRAAGIRARIERRL